MKTEREKEEEKLIRKEERKEKFQNEKMNKLKAEVQKSDEDVNKGMQSKVDQIKKFVKL